MLLHPRRLRLPAELLFFTADHHFGHSSIIGHCDRPFRDVGEMDESLVNLWNAKVPRNGVTVVLGDMFWKRDVERWGAVMRRLNGVKHLVLGSHDDLTEPDCEELGFESVSRVLAVVADGTRMVCSHCPFLEWDGYWRGAWHLHGHTHGRLRHPSVRALDVGVDPNAYMPLSFFEIRDRLKEAGEREMADIARRDRHDPLGSLS